MKYKLKIITLSASYKLSEKSGWEWICANNCGSCCWNRKTGELLWIAEDDGEGRYNELVKK